MKALSRFLGRLRRSSCGNAAIIVAAGMPALIGGAGFAVDISQWYMWKSELQFAVDQAALAGAYARASEETEGTFVNRANQEYRANLSKTTDFASDPAVSLASWATGTDNSVVVTASATETLPFSSFLTGTSTTVRVSAQAAFEEGVNYTSCLIAVDEDASGAITIGGSAQFIAGCGIAALSNAADAITVNGNPTIEAGYLIAAGGIDDWFDTNSSDTILENQTGLTDPFAGLTPPTNTTPQTYTCPRGKSTTTYIADQVVTRTQITYSYWKKSGSGYVSNPYAGPKKKTDVDSTETRTNVTLSALPTSNPEVTGPTSGGYVWVDGTSNNKIYERAITTITKTYTNARIDTNTENGSAAVLQPGTYTDLVMRCDTIFSGGIYVLDGGMFTVNAQYNVTGSGVMFVLKNGAGIVINGGASVNLTAMTVSQLESAGVPYDQAVRLEGMLIFEDPASPGNSQNKINGNSATLLNGTVYLPKSNLDLRGSAGVSSQCLMLVAATITLSGNVEMTSFCPPDLNEDTEVLSTKDRVRLVS